MTTATPALTQKALVGLQHTIDGPMISVHIIWGGAPLDRPDVGGWGLPNTPHGWRLARRLALAIECGRATRNAEIKTDVNGATYVSAEHTISGRTMHADLKRLGF